MLRKVIIFVITGLFIGASVFPNISGYISSSSSQNNKKNDDDLKPGWPRYTKAFGQSGLSDSLTPTLGDVDGDSIQDVIIHTNVQEYVFKGDGSDIDGWPTYYHAPPYITNGQLPNAAAFDLDNDGNIEVITNLRDYYVGNSYTYCFNVFEKNGVYKDGWPKLGHPEKSYNAFDNPPIIFDLDQDGYYELISSCCPFYHDEDTWLIHVFRYNGENFMGWPYEFNSSFSPKSYSGFLGLNIIDIEKDGYYDILAIIYHNGSTSWQEGYYLCLWNYDGSLKEGYPYKLTIFDNSKQNVYGMPILVDIDNDNELEIGIFKHYGNCYSNNGLLVYLNLDGTIVDGWPSSFENQFIAPSFAVGDIDFDGNIETVFGTCGDCNKKYNVYVFKSDGSIMDNWPQEINRGAIWSQPSIGDIDGDTFPDILVSTTAGDVYAWNKNGEIIDGFPKEMGDRSTSGVAIGDIDGDMKVEIVSATNSGAVYAWDMKGTYNPITMHWPMFYHDSSHTGRFETISRDDTSPNVFILKPENGLYFLNRELRRFLFRKTLIIGWIDIKVEVFDEESGLHFIEIYIDDNLKTRLTDEPYLITWKKDKLLPLKHRHTIKVIAYDNAGNSNSDEIIVWKFF